MAEHFDIIVIGSGAGGGTLAHALAPGGQADPHPRTGRLPPPREAELGRPARSGSSTATATAGHWTDARRRRFLPKQHYYVGGNTKFYGAVLFRMRERDFGGGRPRRRRVAGVADLLRRPGAVLHPGRAALPRARRAQARPDRAVGRRRRTRIRPSATSPASTSSRADLEAAGLHPFHAAARHHARRGRPGHSACIRCDTCDGFPCMVYAKADAHVVCVEPALRHPNVTLLTNAYVSRLETDARRPTGHQGDRGARRSRARAYTADVVVVSAGAINSAALLLRSANDRHPDGLGNGSGVVGRHLMLHNNSALTAFSKMPNPTVFQKTLGVNDFYFGDGEWDFPLGAMQMLGRSDDVTIRLNAPDGAGDPAARPALARLLDHHRGPAAARTTGSSPAATAASAWTTRPTNLEPTERLIGKFKGLLDDDAVPRRACSGTTHYLGGRLGINGVAHQNGTVRFGTTRPRRRWTSTAASRRRQPLRRRLAASSCPARR